MVLGCRGVANSVSRSALLLDEWPWKSCSDSSGCLFCINGEPSLCINSGACTGNEISHCCSQEIQDWEPMAFSFSSLQLLSVWGTGGRTRCGWAQGQLSGVGRSEEFGAFSRADCRRTEAQSLEEGRWFCGHTQPLLYPRKAFTSWLLEAHHNKKPHSGYQPVTGSPVTTLK